MVPFTQKYPVFVFRRSTANHLWKIRFNCDCSLHGILHESVSVSTVTDARNEHFKILHTSKEIGSSNFLPKYFSQFYTVLPHNFKGFHNWTLQIVFIQCEEPMVGTFAKANLLTHFKENL